MRPVLEAPLHEDLAPFTALLWEYEVPHRVVEEADRQILLVAPGVDPEQIRYLYRYWREGGDLERVELRTLRRRGRLNGALLHSGKRWLTLSLLIVSVLVTLLIGFGGNNTWMAAFSFTNFLVDAHQIRYDSIAAMLASGQWWRLVTPIFMHFSVLHILFNLLWVWIVGQRIEARQGPWALLGLVLVSAVASNLAQFWVSGPLFGGMSGVVFGLLGYAWLWDRLEPRYRFGLPPALLGFMVLWLALGFTGILEGMGMGAIANTAHLVGMLAGFAYWPLGRLFRPR